jgi:hypothetical protein
MFTTIDAPSRSRGTVRLMRALSLLFLLAVAFATLYPFSDWRPRTPSLFAFLHDGLPRWWTWFDVLSNVLAYGLLGLLDTGALATSLALAPVIPVGYWAGLRLVARLPEPVFYRVLVGSLLLIGIKLCWDAVRG